MITDPVIIIMAAFIVVGIGEWIKNLISSILTKKWKGVGYSVMSITLSALISLFVTKTVGFDWAFNLAVILAVVETSYQAIFKLPLAFIQSFTEKFKGTSIGEGK